MDKHLRWRFKSAVMAELERKGAAFVEDKFTVPMIEDATAIYEADQSREVEEITEEVVGYYLEHIFALSDEEEDIMEEDEEDDEGAKSKEEELLGVKKDLDIDEGIVGEEGRVTCKICGARFKVLYPHLIAKHDMKPVQYRNMFPNAPLRAGVPEQLDVDDDKKKKYRASTNERIVVLAYKIKKQLRGA